MRYLMYAGLAALLMALVALPALQAQPAATAAPAWTLENAVLNTAAQAWTLAGKNDEQFAAVVRSMVGLVASNRNIKLSDNKEIGQKIGNMIARDVRSDPDELLYSIVDHAVVATVGCERPVIMPTAQGQAVGPWSLPDVITATVSEAWQMSGQNAGEFRKMVDQLTALVLENRDLTLANTKVAGQQFGILLRSDAEAHPDDLLYSVVERSVRQVATPKTR